MPRSASRTYDYHEGGWTPSRTYVCPSYELVVAHFVHNTRTYCRPSSGIYHQGGAAPANQTFIPFQAIPRTRRARDPLNQSTVLVVYPPSWLVQRLGTFFSARQGLIFCGPFSIAIRARPATNKARAVWRARRVWPFCRQPSSCFRSATIFMQGRFWDLKQTRLTRSKVGKFYLCSRHPS